jgi:TolB-like protein/Tfp pilus assembly protein PilF
MASKRSTFLSELKRRKVYHVAVVYIVVGWGVAQGAEYLFGDLLGLSPAIWQVVAGLVVLGFPIALVLAWAYEVRPEDPRSAQERERLRAATSSDKGQIPSAATVLTEDPRPSVAVLPFANLSADPADEYFSDGITFDIINHLAKITDLKVISRTSVMGYRGSDKRLRQIGEELGVANIVEGEVQRAGARVRISAQLVDARTDEHLWAEQYDREVLDVFAIQSDVAQRVAAALKATLTPSERERIEARPTGDFEAYSLYLKGRHFWERRGEGLKRGLDYFQQALEIDPEYALAHAGVADCFNLLGFYGFLPSREAWPMAKAAAMRALEIDDELGEAHSSLGFVRCCYDWDPQAAEEDFKRAIELNPGYATAYYWYAMVLLVLERFGDVVIQNEKSLEVDPLSVYAHAHFGWTQLGSRDHELAIDLLKRSLELDRNFPVAHWLLGWAYAFLSDFDDGIRHLQRALELSADHSWYLAHLGWAYGASGQTDEAREVLSKLDERRQDGYVRSLYSSVVHIGLGQTQEALDWLERAYEEHDAWMVFLKVDQLFDPLRSEARFIALLEKVGLEG